MRINEIITEEQLDELNLKGLGTGLGKVIGGAAGGVVQGAKNVWSGMKQGYQGAQQALAPDTTGTTAPATTASGATTSPSTSATPTTSTAPSSSSVSPSTAQSTTTAPEPQATLDELDSIKALVQKLNPEQKQEVAAELQKPEIQQPSAPAPQQAPAAPTGTSVDIGQVKQQSAQQAQAAQTDKATAQQQIAATQQANSQKAKQDAAIKAAKDAAMAKPAFQQTASDKLAIQKAQQMGIREAVSESKQPKKPAPKQPAKKPTPGKKKKIVVAEFNSKFLGIPI